MSESALPMMVAERKHTVSSASAASMRRWTVLLCVALFGVGFQAVAAQEVELPSLSVDVEELNHRIAEVEASTSLDAETAATLLRLYRETLGDLQQARRDQDDEQALKETAANASAEIEAAREKLDSLQRAEQLQDPRSLDGLAEAELEERLAAETATLGEEEARLASLNERYAFEVARPASIRARLVALQQERDRALTDLESLPSTGESAATLEARRWLAQAAVERLSSERRRLDQELSSHQERLALLDMQRSLTAVRVEVAGSRVRRLEEAFGSRLTLAAEQAQRAANKLREEFEDRHPLVRELALENAGLTDQLAQLAADLEVASADRDAMRRLANRVQDELNSTRSKLAVAGLSQALGQLLIEQRRALPDRTDLRQAVARREARIAEVGLQQISLAEERRALRDPGGYLDDLVAELTPEEAATVRPELEQLAASRLALVRQALDYSASLMSILSDLDLDARQLVESVAVYDEFLASRLLWIRNTMPIEFSALQSLPQDTVRLLQPSGWRQFFRDLTAAIGDSPLLAIVLLALLSLALFRHRFLALVDRSGEQVGRIRTDRFSYSMTAFGATVLAGSPLPLLLFTSGWIVSTSGNPAVFSSAVSTGLVMVGTDFLILQLLYDACRVDGLAEKHCRWPTDSLTRMRFELGWLRVVLPAARFVGEVSGLLDSDGFFGGLAVLGLLASAVALGVFIVRIFLPEGGVLSPFLEGDRHSLLSRLRPIWFGALCLVLPVLILLWLVGYSYSADVLAVAFMHTLWLLIALALLQGLLTRWVMLGYQRLRLQAAREKIEEERAVREAEKAGVERGVDEVFEVEEETIDFDALGNDNRRLLKTVVLFSGAIGLWFIWSEVVPAFGFLQEVSLWSRSALEHGEAVQVPVTLADLLFALIAVAITIAAARGLPSLLEFLMLQHTAVTAGGRYTITTLSRYAIIGLGSVVVFGSFGGSWSQIQWLVAALGVGIGFGLQEIVANFISGLIILFERPIRVGDIVTVGETSGTVTRIKIRATTITDWDRKELLVPNREFISNRLLNWTLSDSITRIVIPTGIAYGGDVFKAMQLMEEAAREHANVLEDPAPIIIFEGFGDNALQLSLRAFVPSMDNRLGTLSDLHGTINEKFKDAGVTIAFPQRDVHLDTNGPLEIRLRSQDPDP